MAAATATLCQPNLVDIIRSRPDLKALYKALKTANLLATLASSQNITVLAPNNAALATFSQKNPHCPPSKTQLRNLLLNHVFSPALTSSNLVSMNGQTITALSGATYLIVVVGTTVSLQYVTRRDYFVVEAASVVVANLTASNGILHVINQVLTS